MPLARNQLRLLSLLAERGDEQAGITLADAVGGIGRSSVYAALAALQRDGYVTARWNVEGKRPMRMFSITDTGRAELARESSEWRKILGGPS